jgi:hypothetical protein
MTKVNQSTQAAYNLVETPPTKHQSNSYYRIFKISGKMVTPGKACKMKLS